MAHKILKRFVSRTVSVDGKLERVDKMPIYIETTGKLRMFIEVPAHVAETLGTTKDPGGEHVLGDFDKSRFALYGRDPDALERAYFKLLEAYVDHVRSVSVAPFIIVRFKPTGISPAGHHPQPSFNAANMGFELKVERYLKDSNERWYEWRRRPEDHLRVAYRYSDKEQIVIPYTDELWAAIESMQMSLAKNVLRFAELINSSDFAPRLLAGAQLQLTGPEK